MAERRYSALESSYAVRAAFGAYLRQRVAMWRAGAGSAAYFVALAASGPAWQAYERAVARWRTGIPSWAEPLEAPDAPPAGDASPAPPVVLGRTNAPRPDGFAPPRQTK